MLLSKSRIFFLLLLIPLPLFGFSDKNCLKGYFLSTISHNIKPFGIFQNILIVKKNECNITILHERYKYLKDKWHIDICRMPVHIKYGQKAVEVFKKINACTDVEHSSIDGFCEQYKKLIGIFQDDGLIFAPGNKEDLFSDHGKLYCGFLLLQGYLKEGIVYNSESKVINPKKNLNKEKVEPKVEKKPLAVKPILPKDEILPIKKEDLSGIINEDFMNKPVEGAEAFPGRSEDLGRF